MKKSYYDSQAHKHTQPVRVLYQNLKHWFKNTYPQFQTEELDKAIKNLGLHEEINVIDREDKVAMPAGVGTFKIITIQETFLSYLWCISYSLLFIYDKQIHEPKINPDFELTDDLTEKLSKAHSLFKYGLSLLKSYNYWDIEDLPNPEYYDELDDEYIEKANGVYVNAVNFILLHELAHVSLGHIDNDISHEENGTKAEAQEILDGEYEADAFAFERIVKGASYLTNQSTVAAGVVTGLCSFLFFTTTLKGGDHPDPDERLKIALDKLNLQPEDNLWGVSCLAFKLWAMATGIELNWPPIVDTYQDLFNLTVQTLNKRKH
ncbi:hypothetical protein GCM10023185_32880 [Hymenobacter saemangeumensis]|uniref:Peptidase U49 n=2 Tax=Hymenobacter saemangeumensis TaxID=1084522 RepID=A0ABP8IN30_9BACT